jgi:SnoaL-like domain
MSTGTAEQPTGTRAKNGHLPTVPADAEHFVAEAARISNAADVQEALAVYAPDAVLECITDGTLLVHRGTAELRPGIEVMFSVARARRILVSKQLVATTSDTIVNIWRGTVAGKHTTRGIEVWRFNTEGKVCHQQMYTFLNVCPDSDWVQRLRLLVLSPRTALAFLRAQIGAAS